MISKPYSLTFAAALIAAGLTACQVSPSAEPENSPLSVAGSSRLRLNELLTVPSGKSRAYVQDGQAKLRKRVNEYRPYCYFLANRPNGQQRDDMAIDPDTFQVGNVYRRRYGVGLEPPVVAFFAGGGNEGGSARTWATVFEISSASQPAVTQLVCAIWSDYAYDRLSLADVEDVLGDLATVESAGN